MERIPEPELMLDEAQARAYARADFDSAHSLYPVLFAERFPNRPATALVLDLGCGPCDVTIRFANANPGYRFHAVDGSATMLQLAPPHPRIQLIHGCLPGVRLPAAHYDVIISSSVLHHLHDPQVLWQTVRQRAQPGTLVFVVDLFRPPSREAAQAIVERNSGAEPEILKRDFFNSLRAAFTPAEVRRQLGAAGLPTLRVRTITDRHLAVSGIIGGARRSLPVGSAC